MIRYISKECTLILNHSQCDGKSRTTDTNELCNCICHLIKHMQDKIIHTMGIPEKYMGKEIKLDE